MKKFTAFLLASLMALSLAACSGANGASSTSTGSTSQNVSSDAPSSSEASSAPSSSQASTAPAESSEDEASDSSNQAEESSDPQPDNEVSDGTKILVAYFSATNTTKGLAVNLADDLGADLYEIVPQEPYSSADLNWNDSSSRSTVEMNDPSARPAISGSVENMAQYDIIFLGYPIWWGNAPRIMDTFIESYDFSGKTIIPFCTSSSSGFGNSDSQIKSEASGATWLSGHRFSGSASRDEVLAWANGLGLELAD